MRLVYWCCEFASDSIDTNVHFPPFVLWSFIFVALRVQKDWRGRGKEANSRFRIRPTSKSVKAPTERDTLAAMQDLENREVLWDHERAWCLGGFLLVDQVLFAGY